MDDERPWPQQGRERMIIPAPVGRIGTGAPEIEMEMLARMDADHVFMMGDNPALRRMPERPKLVDFFRYRFGDITIRHLTTSAKRALDEGMDEKIVLACLLHDISNGCFVRADHGYWGAQMIAPYVSEEIAWAVKYHQPLRYFADESVGYQYPDSYRQFFGPDYVPPEYIRRDAEYARNHRWYMSSRLVTLYDLYFFDDVAAFDPEIFTDIIGRHFKEPEEGLGFDGSPVAHMWRTMIWPNNFL
ncbi:HD domain-containing protein [Sphingomonas sp. MMS24-J13]|uniref:HD domain-containing protein n=1 Tax=Sphingomonas sp. MMS24-J13 TaxID=3238686 RepID=UPI003850A92B